MKKHQPDYQSYSYDGEGSLCKEILSPHAKVERFGDSVLPQMEIERAFFLPGAGYF
jgi:hypothetical protein